MVPTGGRFAAGPEGARKLAGQIRPHIAIPVHYWDDEGLLRRFLRGARSVRKLERGPLYVTKRKPPPPALIAVLSH